MSLLDKVIASVTPEADQEDRQEARRKARTLSGGSGWLALVLDHHEQIEAAFAAVKSASSAASRRAAQKELAVLLTGHSIAEEAVLWFPKLRQIADATLQARPTKRYGEEFSRYMSSDA